MMIFKDNEVEVFEFNGQVLFNPKDVAACLEISDVNSSIRKFNEKHVTKLTNSDVHDMHIRKLNNAGEKFLTESGVYKLIFRSQKEEAEEFQDWISDEVLPAIRKYGGYLTPEKIEECHQNPEAVIQIVNKLREENSKLKTEIEVNSPLIEFAKFLTDREGTISVQELAVLLTQGGFDTGRNRFLDYLRCNKYLIRKNGGHIPTQKASKMKLFKIVYTSIPRSDGSIDMKPTPLVTAHGQKYFFEKLLSKNVDEQLSA